MLKWCVFGLFVWAVTTGFAIAQSDRIDDLARAFAKPPAEARPWVYWTWIDGNLTKQGITADLEAMQRVGIGGALILDVDQSMPRGPVRFLDANWRELFKHTVQEAKRLGLEINMNNGPGYYGSGGPWIAPENGMQSVVFSETHVEGGKSWSGQLAIPSKGREYRDIAVIAVQETKKSKYQIPDFTMKSLGWKTWIAYKGTQSAPIEAEAPAEAIIPQKNVVDLTANMQSDGTLAWNALPGEWTIIRFGYACNGHLVGPSLPGDAGPETNKLDRAATQLHFDTFVKRLNELVGPEAKNTLVATHIDSWEGGGQNWTAAMRDEFKKRRGYDPILYLPILTGRVLGDLQISERFLFDIRATVSELTIENYTTEFQRLARAAGLRCTFESYTTIAHDSDNAVIVDEPMAEFWTPNGQGADFHPTLKSMSSAAHLCGHSIVGAEAFTSGNREKFLYHPAMIKSIGDDAFCGGASRFVIHRYAAQPFDEKIKPGMQMGPWGLHYERTNTWWEFALPWHEYLTRCQYLLRQGSFVADVLMLESEEPLRRFKNLALEGYDYDACGPATFRSAHVIDGKFVFPSGASYRLLVLPRSEVMSVELLRAIRDLVRAGGAIVGEPPQRTPGLTNYPQADRDLEALVAELWGTAEQPDRAFGKGRVFRSMTPEKALAVLGILPDFTDDAELKFIHRQTDAADIYFVSHKQGTPTIANCRFRISGRQPELWNPESGSRGKAPVYFSDATSTTISIPFQPNGSTFVIFPRVRNEQQSIATVLRDGKPLIENGVCGNDEAAREFTFDLFAGQRCRPGSYVFRKADGTERIQNVQSLPEPQAITGPWQLRPAPSGGAPAELTLEELESWSKHPDEGMRYFSGTATYSKVLKIPAWSEGQRLQLDLGTVQVMARVRLNGKDLGILWKPPYRVDITPAARAGENALEIDVVNLWVNRLIGDEQLPEDAERNPNGTVRAWPQWLLDGASSPTGRRTFSSWRLWKAGDPLQESGLLGPVVLQTVQIMTVPE